MANFAVAASPETIDKANKVMSTYARDGEKKEDTLLRILNLAEAEYIKGTHPELEEALRSVDATITTLIKQINGIVAGQDNRLAELKKQLDSALDEKKTALETAKAWTEETREKMENDRHAMEEERKKSEEELFRACQERAQAIRERDDARIIAKEKESNNNLLLRQMTSMEEELKGYHELKAQYTSLQEDHRDLIEKNKEDIRKMTDSLREAEQALKEAKKAYEKLSAEFTVSKAETKDLTVANTALSHQIVKLEQQALKDAGAAELALEKAVNKKEKEMDIQLRQADKENARLTAIIEQLKLQYRDTQGPSVKSPSPKGDGLVTTQSYEE